MNTQKLLLRIMLWSLAIAAVVGVAAVLFARGDWSWMVIGTGISTAIACALLFPVSALVERPHTRTIGLLAMAAVVFEFLCSLVLIWELPRALGLFRAENPIVGTMFSLAIAVLLTMASLKAMHTRIGRRAGWLAIGVIVATFLCFELGMWSRILSIYGGDDWIETGLAIFALLGLAVVCHAGDTDLPKRRWRHIGTAAAVVACFLALGGIWFKNQNPLVASLFINLCAIAAVAAHANLCLFSILKPEQRWVRNMSIVTMSIASASVALLFTQEELQWNLQNERVFGRISGAAGIMASFGSLALCVLSRINTKTEFQTETDDAAQIELFCPRCRKRQSIAPGKSKCTHCDLKIEVRFEEPRCTTCEYLLVGLTGNICPECGNSIASLSP